MWSDSFSQKILDFGLYFPENYLRLQRYVSCLSGSDMWPPPFRFSKCQSLCNVYPVHVLGFHLRFPCLVSSLVFYKFLQRCGFGDTKTWLLIFETRRCASLWTHFSATNLSRLKRLEYLSAISRFLVEYGSKVIQFGNLPNPLTCLIIYFFYIDRFVSLAKERRLKILVL